MADNDTGAAEFAAELDHEQATLDDYFDLMEDRPIKFTPEQAGYSPKPKFKEVCRSCLHFFRCDASGHTVCEIMRPLDEKEKVMPHGWCRFYTNNYRDFPLLEK